MMLKAGLTFSEPGKAEPYAEALRQAGIEPVLISPEDPRSLAGLQGLLLSGGTDLNPVRYGAPPHPGNETPDNARDELEMGLLAEALASGLPVLAICRGMQLFNVAHGGSLIQNLENSAAHVVRGGDPAQPAHQILVEPGTRLAAILGDGAHAVNSRHHQAVERVGAGLRVTARSAPDGVIEALERSDCPLALAVQWHPEDQARRDATQMKLFEAFAEALGKPRG
ncbi:MAG TPA: gamma-glutamyl-gamma-aminobutyrate hydrolase family protein [Bryobacteraceae bacterium]|nr:gamma-glutamyl-gamma-aminobutyrate hydrolase family protein [Bryobacteraceae bacterium]